MKIAKILLPILTIFLLAGCGSDAPNEQEQAQKDACFLARQYMFYSNDDITGTNQFSCVFSDHVQTEKEGVIEITLEPTEFHADYEEFLEIKESSDYSPFFVLVDVENDLVQDLNISPIPFVKDEHAFKPLEIEITEDPEKDEEAPETVTYKVEFIANWSAETHPDYYPENAHFSPFVAYSHAIDADIFREGNPPSPGMEEMAETGATNLLIPEVQELIDGQIAYKQAKGNVFDSPGTDSSELEFTQTFNEFTFVSMLAPSPDWFVAESTTLFDGEKWVEQVEIDLVTYDAGSDSGETLTAEDLDTDPKEPVTVFGDELQNLGKVVLTRQAL